MVTAAQTIRMYDVLGRHFDNRYDAQVIVEGIESVIATKFDAEKAGLATKDDLKQLEIRMEQGFKEMLKWMIVLMLGFSSLIIALIKLT